MTYIFKIGDHVKILPDGLTYGCGHEGETAVVTECDFIILSITLDKPCTAHEKGECTAWIWHQDYLEHSFAKAKAKPSSQNAMKDLRFILKSGYVLILGEECLRTTGIGLSGHFEAIQKKQASKNKIYAINDTWLDTAEIAYMSLE